MQKGEGVAIKRQTVTHTDCNGTHSTFPPFFLSLESRQIFCTQFERQTESTDLLPSVRLPMRQCMMDRRIAATEWDFKFRKSPPLSLRSSAVGLENASRFRGFLAECLFLISIVNFTNPRNHTARFLGPIIGHPGGRKTGRCHYTPPSSS